MPHLVFIGSCQIQAFGQMAQALLPSATMTVVDALSHTSHRPEFLAAITQELKRADFIFVQKDGGGPYAPEAIKQDWPDKTFIIATFVFRGLHPDGCYVGHFNDHFQEPSLYHAYAILESFLSGRSVDWTIANVFSAENLARLGLLTLWNTAIEEVRAEDAGLDFPAAALVDSFCRAHPGFQTFNHPTLDLLQAYLLPLLRTLGLAPRPVQAELLCDPLMIHDIAPVYDSVATALDLSYRTTQHWLIAHKNNAFMDQPTFVHASYAAYAAAPRGHLFVDAPRSLRPSEGGGA